MGTPCQLIYMGYLKLTTARTEYLDNWICDDAGRGGDEDTGGNRDGTNNNQLKAAAATVTKTATMTATTTTMKMERRR